VPVIVAAPTWPAKASAAPNRAARQSVSCARRENIPRSLVNAAAPALRSVHSLTRLWKGNGDIPHFREVGCIANSRAGNEECPHFRAHFSRAPVRCAHIFANACRTALAPANARFDRRASKARWARHFLRKLESCPRELRPSPQFRIGICQTSHPRKETPTSEWRGHIKND
jgi:hypothetical protein